MIKSLSVFAREAIRNPRNIGAVTPSGRALGRLMAQGLGANSGTVVEIGPGTGGLTRGLIAAGVPEENLVLVDMNEVFCKALTRRYGKARVVHGPAQDLPGLGLGALECVVSGLPMLNFPASLQKDILGAVFAVLGSGGKLVQFTYGARPPVERELLQAMHLEWRLRGRVWRNLPPANVYEFFRHAPPG